MKKRILFALALLIAAALCSSCALTGLLFGVREVEKGLPNATMMPPAEPEIYDVYVEAAEYDDAIPLYGGAYTASAYIPDDFNTEEYAAVTENGFRSVATSPLSTFSADVDTASYCNLRRMLNDGWSPSAIPSGAVRVEEMLNYFRYDYAAPEGDDRFGVTAKLAPCPWNPENALLLLGVRAADAQEKVDEGSNLVFLVDVSGSMDEANKLGLVKQALTMLTDALGEKDAVSIVTNSDGEEILMSMARTR